MVYHKVNFKLTTSQQEKLKHAFDNNISISLRLSKSKISPTGIPLMLTISEINKLEDGNYHNINISSTRIKKMGGFIQYILPALGGVAALTGIITSIIHSVKTSKSADAQASAAAAAEEYAKQQLARK